MKRRRITSLDTLCRKVGETNFRAICRNYVPTLNNKTILLTSMAKEAVSKTYVDYDMTKTAATKILEDFNKGILDRYILDSGSKDLMSMEDFIKSVF